MWYALFRDEKGASRIDLVHQIVTLHIRFQRSGKLDRGSIVDADVYSTEPLDGLRHGFGHLGLVPYVAYDWQRPAPGLFDFFGRRIDGPRQLWMRLGRLGSNGNVGAVTGGAQCDRQTYAARTA